MYSLEKNSPKAAETGAIGHLTRIGHSHLVIWHYLSLKCVSGGFLGAAQTKQTSF
jgi:hypothetical protein